MPKYLVFVKVKRHWVASWNAPNSVECLPNWESVVSTLHKAGYPHMGYCDEFKALKNGACVLGYFDPMDGKAHEVYKLIPMEVSHVG